MEVLNPVGTLRRIRTDQILAILAEAGHRGRQQAARFERIGPRG